MVKMRAPKKISYRNLKRHVHCVFYCASACLLAITLMSGYAVAQAKNMLFNDANPNIGAKIQKIGLPLTPLSLQQMSSETAQGVSSSSPSLVSRSQGTSSVLLWDEINPGKAASQNAMAGGTVTLNIVH